MAGRQYSGKKEYTCGCLGYGNVPCSIGRFRGRKKQPSGSSYQKYKCIYEVAVSPCLCVGGVFFALGLRKLTCTAIRRNTVFICSLMAAALLPVLWMLVIVEHSDIHYWFSCKEFSISGFAILSLVIYLKSLVHTDEPAKKEGGSHIKTGN